MQTLEAPASDLDPFSIAFFDDPFPEHKRLREAGPVVRLRHLGCWGVARWQEVTAVFSDWQAYCLLRGVGLQDFAKETPWRSPSLVLERDPPEHTSARVGAEPGALARRHEAAAGGFRRRGRTEGRGAAGLRQLRRHPRPSGGLPAMRSSPMRWASGRTGGTPAALRRRHLQRLRSGQRAAPPGAGRRRPAPRLGDGAMPAGEPGARQLRRGDPRRGRYRGADGGGGAGAGPLALRPGSTPRSTASAPPCVPGPLPRRVCEAARRPGAGPRRLRGGDPLREPGADLLPQHRPAGPTRAASRWGRARRC